MSGIDERKKAVEFQLHHDSETRFKIAMRRNKLLGKWAAEQMGLAGESVEEYAKQVVKADFEEAGDEDVIRKVAGDFKEKGTPIDVQVIRQKLQEFTMAAADQLTNEK